MIFDAALIVNPAFDIYRIFDTVSVSIIPQIKHFTSYQRTVSHFVGRPRIPVSRRLQPSNYSTY